MTTVLSNIFERTASGGDGSLTSDPAAVVLAELDNVTRVGEGWSACCPAHDDNQASLSIRVGKDGRVLVHCFAGCTAEEILAAIDLTWADLFPGGGDGGPGGNGATPQQSEQGLSLSEYAKAKHLSEASLSKLGVGEITYLGRPAVRIPYLDADGNEAAVRFRCSLAGPNRFRWRNGIKPLLYGVWKLDEARKRGYVWLVEGESDCHTLWVHNIPAIGLPGATNRKEDRDAALFDGIERIYVLIEPDRGGDAVLGWLAKSSIRERVQLVPLPGYKDISELHVATGGVSGYCREARKVALPWADHERVEQHRAAQEALARCQQLARDPAILDRVAEELVRAGVVGEERAVKLLYLALTSRFLDRPVSVAVKGVSSGGKSYTSEQVLRLFPEDAYYTVTAVSERVLAYSQELIKHRFLVMYEAAGMESEFATYLVRSLLSEGRIRYETVDKTDNGLEAKLIEREGPTGLLVTTTRVSLHPENETRLLSVPVTDTPEQTSEILTALAEEAEDTSRQGERDLGAWHALQTWLAGAEHRVTIPYAKRLAAQVPPVATRLRRDFKAILTLIRAHAILHQQNRKRTPDGSIIATLDDYASVRGLIADLVGDVIGATVPSIIRETVAAVQTLLAKQQAVTGYSPIPEGVSLAALAKELGGLDRSTAYRRVQQCFQHGYLENLETRPRKPFKLVTANPLPDDQQILPHPEDLPDACCTVAATPADSTTPSPAEASPADPALPAETSAPSLT